MGEFKWSMVMLPRGRSSSPGRVKNFYFSSSRPALGPTQLPTKWVPGALPRSKAAVM
jgi:hypothetical protein